MAGLEREKKPEWRTAEGRLREETPVSQIENEPHLTGYRAEKDRREAEKPREYGRLGGAYGDVAVGISRKKKLTVAVSRRRNRRGPAIREEERAMKERGSRRMNLARGNFRTNPSDKQRSAVAYHSEEKIAPDYLLNRFRDLMETHSQRTLEENIPFLTQKEDAERLHVLQNTADRLRTEGAAPSEQSVVEEEKEQLRQSMAEKTVQENRLRIMLRKAKEESERMSGERWDIPRNTVYAKAEDTSPEDAEAAPDEEEEQPPEPGKEDENRQNLEDF